MAEEIVGSFYYKLLISLVSQPLPETRLRQIRGLYLDSILLTASYIDSKRVYALKRRLHDCYMMFVGSRCAP